MTTDDVSGSATDGPADPRDLLGAYALDAVDDVERRAVERLIAVDPQAARELAGLTATAAMLGAAASAAPPRELRSTVLDQITRTPQVGAAGPASTARAAAPPATARTRASHRRGVPRRTVWLAVAATALGAATVPSAVAWQLTRQTQQVEQQALAISDLLADPTATVVRGSVAGGGNAVGVLTNEQALFTATGLPDPGAGKAYQLWVMRDGVPVPDAVLADNDGRVRAITDGVEPGDGLAITVEPSRGSEHPTSDVLVLLTPA
ncbi:MAG: anti-sigma factor domain-containing protein [Cellulomonas sp.]